MNEFVDTDARRRLTCPTEHGGVSASGPASRERVRWVTMCRRRTGSAPLPSQSRPSVSLDINKLTLPLLAMYQTLLPLFRCMRGICKLTTLARHLFRMHTTDPRCHSPASSSWPECALSIHFSCTDPGPGSALCSAVDVLMMWAAVTDSQTSGGITTARAGTDGRSVASSTREQVLPRRDARSIALQNSSLALALVLLLHHRGMSPWTPAVQALCIARHANPATECAPAPDSQLICILVTATVIATL